MCFGDGGGAAVAAAAAAAVAEARESFLYFTDYHVTLKVATYFD